MYKGGLATVTFYDSGDAWAMVTVKDPEDAMDSESAYFRAVEVYFIGGISVIPVGGTVNLLAISKPLNSAWPDGTPQWSIESQPEGGSASISTPSYCNIAVVSGFSEPGEYVVKAQCGDGDPGDNTFTVTAIDVYIITIDWLAWYFVDDSHPNVEITAVGHPSGGTYQWEVSQGADKLHIVEGADSSTVTIRADAPSGALRDVSLKCTYTYGGCSDDDTKAGTVLTPVATDSTGGQSYETGEGDVRMYRRQFYHRVKDQFDTEAEIPDTCADENVTQSRRYARMGKRECWISKVLATRRSLRTLDRRSRNKGFFRLHEVCGGTVRSEVICWGYEDGCWSICQP